MFSYLSKYKRIYVTGPQRSGTTIASRMIAVDTNFTHIDEKDFSIWDKEKWLSYQSQNNIVIHCPAMSICIEEVLAPLSLIVFMIRDIDDIIKSQSRINWSDKSTRKSYQVDKNDKTPISVIKYNNWESQKKFLSVDYLELNYNDLKSHSLWVDKTERKDYGRRQWK